jgi:DNA gyrase inhibitor GyrI
VTVLHSGTTKKYSDQWDSIFSESKPKKKKKAVEKKASSKNPSSKKKAKKK